MPREARKISETGVYHIILRGINRQSIFINEEDYDYFLYTLLRYKKISNFKIFSYILMTNHLHILLKVCDEPLSLIMKRICGSYVYFFNHKYNRIGNLFQDRFKSKPVENDIYLLTVLRYIHQNPLKARIVKNIKDYKWSSYNEYLRKDISRINKLVDKEYIFDLFRIDKKDPIIEFIKFNKLNNDDNCLNLNNKIIINDTDAICIIIKVCSIDNPEELRKFDLNIRNHYLHKLKDAHGLSLRQIERITGINRETIHKA